MTQRIAHDARDWEGSRYSVASATVIEIGDNLYSDGTNAVPASSQTDQLTEAANQIEFASNFIGVAMDRSRNGDTDRIRVADKEDTVMISDCASTTWAVGDLVGVVEAASGTALEDQKVGKVTDRNAAIGECVEAGTSVTEVKWKMFKQNQASAALDGDNVNNVADDNVIGGIPVLHKIVIAGGAAADKDITLTHKTLVTDVWAVHTGGAGEVSDTIQVKNGANAITDAMSWAGADKAVVRAAEIDDAQHEIAAGGTLRVTTVDNDAGGDVGAGIVYVQGLRIG